MMLSCEYEDPKMTQAAIPTEAVKRVVEDSAGTAIAGRKQMGVDPQGEGRGRMAAVLGDGPDAHAGGQEHLVRRAWPAAVPCRTPVAESHEVRDGSVAGRG